MNGAGGMVRQATRSVIESRGFKSGTDIEDLAALHISRAFCPPVVRQQFRLGRYRLDFAWPEHRIALEVDGVFHRTREGAYRDQLRDSELRSQGWLIFHVDDAAGTESLEEQMVRVLKIVHCQHGR